MIITLVLMNLLVPFAIGFSIRHRTYDIAAWLFSSLVVAYLLLIFINTSKL